MKVVLAEGNSYGYKGRLFQNGAEEVVTNEEGEYLISTGKFRAVVKGVAVPNPLEVQAQEEAAEASGARQFTLEKLTGVKPASEAEDETDTKEPAEDKQPKGNITIRRAAKPAEAPVGADGEIDTGLKAAGSTEGAVAV